MEDENPVSSIVAAIHKQRVKKTAALPKNTIADPAGVIIYEHLKLAGVKADPLKRIISLMANKEKFDPKILSDVSQLVSTNYFEAFALLYNSLFGYVQRNVKNDINKSIKLKKLESVFKEIAFITLQSVNHIKISSLNKEFHALMCDSDINIYNAHNIIKERFNILSQRLQHQVDDSYEFESIGACLIHNIMNPCKDSKCALPHVCSICGKRDHIAIDTRCPKYHLMKDWFIKRLMEINKYYTNKSKKLKGYPLNSNNRYHRNYGYNRYDRNNNNSNQPNQYNNNSDNRNPRDNRDYRVNRERDQ